MLRPLSAEGCRETAAGVIVLLCMIASTYADDRGGAMEKYHEALRTGDLSAAAEIGRGVLSGRLASQPNSGALTSLQDYVANVEDTKALAVYKLGMIREAVVSGTPGPFSYVSPSAQQLYSKARARARRLPLSHDGLNEEDRQFAQSFACLVTRLADEAILGSYQGIISLRPADEPASMAQAYVAAYIVGTHNKYTYPEAFAVLRERAGAARSPAFLVEQALSTLTDPRVAYEVLLAIDAAVPDSLETATRTRLLSTMAESAERNGDLALAGFLLRTLVTVTEGPQAEEALIAAIKLFGQKAGEYSAAAEACTEYLKRFPEGREALAVEYLRGRYECEASDFPAAVEHMKAFADGHANSELVPNAMLLEGMARIGQGETEKAIEVFGRVLARDPGHACASKAQFLMGSAYFASHRYGEAREAFQKTIDMYPQSDDAAQAKQYLRLAVMEVHGESAPE